jgi:endonuclease/exonuclease/phosphatase family metal-dependent hydrolase
MQHSKNTKTQITIATFNLCNYLEPPFAFYEFERIYSCQQWHKKQCWISEYITNKKPDIIGFQEVFSIDSLKNLLQKLGYLYFSVVDTPEVIDDFIYKKPVVALASKFPIIESAVIKENAEHIAELGLITNFTFSRKILRATIAIPDIGLCDSYVVHFKSKRSMLEYDERLHSHSAEKKLSEHLKANITGRWASSIQRGSEAALLLLAIIERREKTGQPMILMGDFNNSIDDGVLNHLLTHSLRYVPQQDQTKYLAKYCLYDAWQLFTAHHCNKIECSLKSESKNKLFGQQNTMQTKVQLPRHTRKPTHYFSGSGSVLDYILLSAEFDARFDKSLCHVSDYETYDQHLINPIFDRDGESTDHAIVSVSITIRR